LAYTEVSRWPDDEFLRSSLMGLEKQLLGKVDLSLDIQCRFLAGISVPAFSRNKVRQLNGFSSCENLRYREIKTKLQGLLQS
jgi:ATP-dependent DNA helicase RecQ